MSYTMYTPLNVWLDPASVTDVVAYIQNYLSENTIYSEEEIEGLIHDYLIAHPELIGGVQSVNGKTGTVVLSASDINTENNVTIESVLASLSSQISSIAASVATNTANITSLTGRVSTAETDISNLKSAVNNKAPAIYNTVSGATASFEDGADGMPLKALNVIIEPVQAAGTPTQETPLPISGWTGAKIARAGKNLLHNTGTSGTYDNVAYTKNEDGSLSKESGTANGWTGVPLGTVVLIPGNYVLSSGIDSANQYNYYINAKSGATNHNTSNGPKSFTVSETTTFSITAISRPNVSVPELTMYPMIRLASDTDQTFVPYKGYDIYSVTFPISVYSGSIDWIAKKLKSRPYYASYNGETLFGPWLSSMNVYAPNTTPTIGAQVVDMGGAETIYDLAVAPEIDTLYGTNNIWADCGPVSVDYPVDTMLYIEKDTAYYLNKYKQRIDAIKWNLGVNRTNDTLVFAVTTDNHYDNRYNINQPKYAELYSKIAEKVGCEFQINLGDIITERGTVNQNQYGMAEMASAYNTSYVPLLYAIGHHELYPYQGETDGEAVYLVDKKNAVGTLGPYTRWINCVYENNNPFSASFYADFPRQKIRIVSIDSVSRTPIGFSENVLAFVKNQALSNVPSGYKIILFSHVPSRGPANVKGVYPINGSAKDPEKVDPGVEPLESIVNDYISDGGHVLCHIHGHVHWDNIVKQNDMSYPLISVCAASVIQSDVSQNIQGVGGNPVSYPRDANDYSAFCMDVFAVNASTGRIDMLRFGVGSNRVYNPT